MLRSTAKSTSTLQQFVSTSEYWGSEYWGSYNRRLPTTPPAGSAIAAGVRGYVAQHAIPRFINTAGDLSLSIDWINDDKILDTDGFSSSINRTSTMVERNWTTPFQVRETLNERRIEKKCTQVP